MDILKKMFEGNKQQGEVNRNKQPTMPKMFGDEFRKPVWFDDCESDDELYDGNRVFGFQIFTNPLEMQKHFEQQMRDVMKSLEQFDGKTPPLTEENVRENYLKPGFEDFFNSAPKPDTDLDGEIYADQLHSLLRRISPDVESLLAAQPPSQPPKQGLAKYRVVDALSDRKMAPRVQRSDEERIMDRIHGISDPDEVASAPPTPLRKFSGGIGTPRAGFFEGAFQGGPRVFRQSVMTQTVRRPDGSSETRRMVQDADGRTNTTITKSAPDGRTETTMSSSDGDGAPPGREPGAIGGGGGGPIVGDRHVFVTKDGYAMPKNIW